MQYLVHPPLMKRCASRILLVLVALAIGGCAIPCESAHAETAATIKHPLTVGDLSKVSKADIIATVQHMQRNEHDALDKLEKTQRDLAAMQRDVETLQKAADKLQAERNWYRSHYDDDQIQIAKLNEAIAKKDHKLDLLGWALAALAAYAVFQLSGSLAGVLSLAVPQLLAGRLVASALTFAAVFAWVRYL